MLVVKVPKEDVCTSLICGDHCWLGWSFVVDSVVVVVVERRFAAFRVSQAELRASRDAYAGRAHLGIRSGESLDYIWIDALRIVQDDPVEWLEEANEMLSVYGNAEFTLTAIGCGNASHGQINVLQPSRYPLPRPVEWSVHCFTHEGLIRGHTKHAKSEAGRSEHGHCRNRLYSAVCSTGTA